MTSDPTERRKQLQNNLARKAIWAANLSARKDRNGFISPEAAREAKVAAGILQPEQIPESHLRLARLEAAERHNLTVAQADAMTGTTAEAIEVEAKALATPPGDTGARTDQTWPATDPTGRTQLTQQIAEAERRGEDVSRLKAQLLLHPDNQPKG